MKKHVCCGQKGIVLTDFTFRGFSRFFVMKRVCCAPFGNCVNGFYVPWIFTFFAWWNECVVSHSAIVKGTILEIVHCVENVHKSPVCHLCTVVDTKSCSWRSQEKQSISLVAVSSVHSEELRLAAEHFSGSCVFGTQRETKTRTHQQQSISQVAVSSVHSEKLRLAHSSNFREVTPDLEELLVKQLIPSLRAVRLCPNIPSVFCVSGTQ